MRVLLTGGSGRLGSELKILLGGSQHTLAAPTSTDLDVRDEGTYSGLAADVAPDVIVHAAAYTDVKGAEDDKETCWSVNVLGTRNAALAARTAGARLVHISTDYVFWGDRGNYVEDDVPGPVRNYYALSKLVAEEAARGAPRHLVIRTSFRPRRWEHPVAFADLYTSQDYVDVIAPEIAQAVVNSHRISYDTLHIATDRKSVLELARRRAPDVKAGVRADTSVPLPKDVSLNSARWQALKRAWKEES